MKKPVVGFVGSTMNKTESEVARSCGDGDGGAL